MGIRSALTALNRHSVCWSGVILGAASVVAIGARQPLDDWSTSHLYLAAGLAKAIIDGASSVGLFVIWPAIIAAALGRPPNIPGGPKPPQ